MDADEYELRRNADLDHLTPGALADLYDGIREGHITDPATIRDVAQAFSRLAQEPPSDTEPPFDAPAAADALLRFAAQVERHMAAQAYQGQRTGSTDLFAPTQDLPLPSGGDR